MLHSFKIGLDAFRMEAKLLSPFWMSCSAYVFHNDRNFVSVKLSFGSVFLSISVSSVRATVVTFSVKLFRESADALFRSRGTSVLSSGFFSVVFLLASGGLGGGTFSLKVVSIVSFTSASLKNEAGIIKLLLFFFLPRR